MYECKQMATALGGCSVSRTGAPLRRCALSNNTQAVHSVQKKVEQCSEQGWESVQFNYLPVLVFFSFLLLPRLLFLSFSFTPAVTRSNPQSNDGCSLTLIKGGPLERGPRITFIRRLVKVYFSLALHWNTKTLTESIGDIWTPGCL